MPKELISIENNAYFRSLEKEDDLPCVLIGTAAVDERLEGKLRKYLSAEPPIFSGHNRVSAPRVGGVLSRRSASI